jgi:SAM-dependent methyltransferase
MIDLPAGGGIIAAVSGSAPRPPAVLDVRTEEQFLRGHLPGAVNLPAGELAARSHELPASASRLKLIGAKHEVTIAGEFLAARGHHFEIVTVDESRLTAKGSSVARLWEPSPFLVESLAQIGANGNGRRALDVACGSGRDAVYLALCGWDVHAIDVLPDALVRAEDLARRNSVRLTAERRDLEKDPSLPLAPFDLVTVFRYLHRPLFPILREAVAPGGYVVHETFHRRTLETGRPPRNPQHLLETGELSCAFSGFELLIARDAVEREGRYVSSLLARRVTW